MSFFLEKETFLLSVKGLSCKKVLLLSRCNIFYNMSKLYITIGISGSGKSTYTQTHFAKEKIVSTDLIRLELSQNINEQKHNEEVFKIAIERLHKILQQSDAVLDATNIDLFLLDKLLTLFPKNDICFLVFRSNVGVCKQRIKSDLEVGKIRAATPEAVVERQAEKMAFLSSYLKDFGKEIIEIHS